MGTSPPVKFHPAGAQGSTDLPEMSQEGRVCHRTRKDYLWGMTSLKMTSPSPLRNKLISLA